MFAKIVEMSRNGRLIHQHVQVVIAKIAAFSSVAALYEYSRFAGNVAIARKILGLAL